MEVNKIKRIDKVRVGSRTGGVSGQVNCADEVSLVLCKKSVVIN